MRNLKSVQSSCAMGTSPHGTEAEVMFGPNSAVAVLPESCTEVQQRLRGERVGKEVRALVAKNGRTLAARPLGDLSAVAISSIAQMLSFPQLPYKFRCHAQVVAMAPEDTCRVTRLEPGGNRFLYAFSLRLQDESGMFVDVLLCGDDAEKFLNGFAADNLVKDREACSIVKRKLARLRAPNAWIDCCLVSYMTRNADSNTHQTCFRLFNTQMCVG